MILLYYKKLSVVGINNEYREKKSTNRKTNSENIYSVAGTLSPLLIGLSIQGKLERLWPLNKAEEQIVPFIRIPHCSISFPVLVCLLEDLNILNSELGQLGLYAAMVSCDDPFFFFFFLFIFFFSFFFFFFNKRKMSYRSCTTMRRSANIWHMPITCT
jgi:hypothetical protein